MAHIQVLKLTEMLLQQKGTFTRRAVHMIFTLALRLFLRRIETANAEAVPASGPVIFVLNHPNGLIDPALVFCALPRHVSFLAKSTLFDIPVAGWLMRTVEALPVYRRVDAENEMARNRLTFDAAHGLLQAGGCIALFPEGISHSGSHLLPLKSGAARIALEAISLRPEAAFPVPLSIVPVGIYYTSKTSFRSEALLSFGAPFAVEPVELGPDGAPSPEDVDALTERIEASLLDITLNTESLDKLRTVTIVGRVVSSIDETFEIRPSLTDRFDLLRRFASLLNVKMKSASQHEELAARIQRMNDRLADVGLNPENLSVATSSIWFVFRYFVVRLVLVLSGLPFSITGAIIHTPAYLIANLIAWRYRKHGVDEAYATVRVLSAIALVPLTWILFSAFFFFRWGLVSAIAAFFGAIFCGYIAMRSMETVADLSGWFKASLVLVRRRRQFLELLVERREIRRQLEQVSI